MLNDLRLSGSREKIILLYGLFILASYITLHSTYRPENEDDPWLLSCAYNYTHLGITDDYTFGDGPENGKWMGTGAFCKTYAFLYSPFLDFFGWSKITGIIVSTSLVVLASLAWYRALRNLRYGAYFALSAALSMLIVEPFFGAANECRSDALVFLLISLATWLVTKRYFLAAGILGTVAFETHPAGLFMFGYCLAAIVAIHADSNRFLRDVSRSLAFLAAGVLISLPYYFALHYDTLAAFWRSVKAGDASLMPFDNFLFQYFYMTKYKRHLPELVLILACALAYVRLRLWRKHLFASVSFVASLLLVLVIWRPNFMYAVFVYPAFLLIVMAVFENFGKTHWLVALWILYLLPQYGFVCWKNRRMDVDDSLARVRAAVPDDGRPVLGRPNDWFVFKERVFHPVNYCGHLRDLGIKDFYLVEDSAVHAGRYPALSGFLAGAQSTVVADFSDYSGECVVKRVKLPKSAGPMVTGK